MKMILPIYFGLTRILFNRIFVFTLIGIMLASCSYTPSPYIYKAITLGIKSKKIRLNESAFLSYNSAQIVLDINSLDGKVIKIKINKDINGDICIDGDCLNKKDFNKKFLSNAYPVNILENILEARPIFNSKNKKRIKNGFYQKINNIVYRVTSKNILFRDRRNNILIKIRYLK